MTTAAVHRLVCVAFHGPTPSADHQVRHIDGMPTNNRADNLCWGTATENEADKLLHGTRVCGERTHFAALSEASVLAIREARAIGAASDDLATNFGISKAQVSRICSGASWSWLSINPAQAAAIRDVTRKDSRRGGGRPPMIARSTVDAIRSRYAAGGASYADLASEYGVSFGHIGRIVRNEQR